jgi:hypothetical protein
VAQGCQGPARGLGGERGGQPQHAQPQHRPLTAEAPVADRYAGAPRRDAGK